MIKIDTLEIQKNIEEKRQIFGKKFEAFLLRQSKSFLKKVDEFLGSDTFCLWSVSIIFLASIFLRSRIDIGCDSGFYLDIANKISQGGAYYHDFFESNFPLSFFIHLIPQYIAKVTGFSHIIVADYFINIVGLLSIFWSSRILKGTNLNKTHQNIIISSFALGFFLRIGNLAFGEFMTKTSFYLLFAFPYISYSFARRIPLNNKEMVWRGILAGLMPCLKPHYIILPLVIELHRFWKAKSLTFFLEIDKLLMVLVGCAYLAFMVHFTPEFFEYMVPMWSSFYSVYQWDSFINNTASQISSKMIFLCSMIAFLRLKCSSEDKVLCLVALSSYVILTLEGMPYALDQQACFFGLVTAVIFKIFYDFVTLKEVHSEKHILLLLFLTMLIFVEGSLSFIKSLVVFWWIILPMMIFKLYRKIHRDFPDRVLKVSHLVTFIIAIIFIVLIAVELFFLQQNLLFTATATLIFVVFLILYEIFYQRFYHTFSSLFIFIFFLSVTSLISYYSASIVASFVGSDFRKSPSAVTDSMIEYTNLHLHGQDKMMVISPYLPEKIPVMSYVDQDHNSRIIGSVLFNTVYNPESDFEGDYDFTFQYAVRNFKNMIGDENMKIMFIKYAPDNYRDTAGCMIGILEYYLRDPEFREMFLSHYQYAGTISALREIKDHSQTQLVAEEKGNFESVLNSEIIKTHSYEIYIRKGYE